MGILSKLRKRREVAEARKEVKKEARKEVKKEARKGVEEKKTTTSDVLPEIDNVGEWLNEIKKMAAEGVNEIDRFYNDIVGKSKSISDFILNLGVISANYLSFRYEVYAKLAEYYGDVNKAIREVDKALEDIDDKFIDELVGVIRKWMSK